jgi:TM2 domain-containing membrane protein YozV
MSRPVDLKNRHLALVLSWMVPGLGHIYQGRIGKGILYAVCILSLFLVGLGMGDWKIVYWRWQNPIANTETFCFPYLFQFWTGLAALPALIQATLLWYGKDLILSGYMSVPDQIVTNGLFQPRGKLVEIGTLYTMVAGLLNILAMYDAYEGPAQSDEEMSEPAAPPIKKSMVEDVGASA